MLKDVKTTHKVRISSFALAHEDVWWNGCIDPCIFDLGNSWR
jgi:hypothetical protein